MPTDAKTLMTSAMNELDQFAAAAAEIITDEPADDADYQAEAMLAAIEAKRVACEHRIKAANDRDRAYARQTIAEKPLLASALNRLADMVPLCVDYQNARDAAIEASRLADEAEAADIEANLPSIEISAAEQVAIIAARNAEEARRVFLAELELSPLAKAAYEAIDAADKKSAGAVEALRGVVKKAREADPELRSALGATKAVSINRKEHYTVADPLAAATALLGWARDDADRRGIAEKLISIDGKALVEAKLELPTPVKVTIKESFTVSVTGGKLTQ